MFAVHGPVPPPEDELLAGVHLGRARTLYQDPSFRLPAAGRRRHPGAVPCPQPADHRRAGRRPARRHPAQGCPPTRTDRPVHRRPRRGPTGPAGADLRRAAGAGLHRDHRRRREFPAGCPAAAGGLRRPGPGRARTAPPFDRAAATGHPGQYPEGRRRRYPVLGPAAGSHRTWLTNHTEGRSGELQLGKGAATTRDRTG